MARYPEEAPHPSLCVLSGGHDVLQDTDDQAVAELEYAVSS